MKKVVVNPYNQSIRCLKHFLAPDFFISWQFSIVEIIRLYEGRFSIKRILKFHTLNFKLSVGLVLSKRK